MIVLKSVNDTLKVITTTTAGIDYSITWVDVTTTTFSPNSSDGTISTATTTTAVTAPAVSTQRQIKLITLRNKNATTSNTVVVIKDISSTQYNITPTITLSPGEVYQYTDSTGWQVLMSNGQIKFDNSATVGYTGFPVPILKIGTAPDTIGYWYCSSKDAGFPGAWAPGTPGVAGRVTDGTLAADAGCFPIKNAGSGVNYITTVNMSSTTAHYHMIFDVLWVNSALVVTTITSQAVASPTLPSRDINGAAIGEGCIIGMLTTTANTNAAVISNSTISYTNDLGTAGKTATLVAVVGGQITATPVIGTITWFSLAAGDKGVKSIESITLGTSLGAGAISLLIARPIVNIPVSAANIGQNAMVSENPGIKIYNGTCLLHCYLTSAVAATTVTGTINVMER